MNPPFKHVWIIGASSGIGRDTALAFAKVGIKVVASARSQDALDALVKAGGGNIRAFAFDVSDRDATLAASDAIDLQYGPIDALLFAAATWNNSKDSQASTSVIKPVFETNVYGALNAIEAVLAKMKRRQSGHIAIISSVAGFRGLPNAMAYGASKAALTHIAEALKFECDPFGVVVQVIHPGFVKTPLTDKNDFKMPFLMSSEAAADRIVNGMTKGGFEITFPRRFTWMLKVLRAMPYALYFPLITAATKQSS